MMHTNGARNSAPPFRSLTIAKLADHEFAPIEWTIDELIPSGALGLLVGRPKLGKSLYAIDMLASVAIGEPFIGRATHQGPAIYVPAEDALRLVRDRMLNRLKGERDLPLHVVPADGSFEQSIRFDDGESLARLYATIKTIGARIVVLDPLREFHHLREDKADDMAGLLRPLRQMAHDLDVSMMLIHHRNKHATDPSLATRGSSAIAGGVDLIMTMEMSNEKIDAELDGRQVLKLYVEGRYGPRQVIGARLRSGLRWESVDPRLVDDVPVRERVQRHLDATGETLTAEDLAQAVKAPKGSVQNVLPGLLKAGVAVRHGAGTKTDPYRYGHYQQPLENKSVNESGRMCDESFAMRTGKTADSSRSRKVYVDSGGTNPESGDDPADVLRVLYRGGLFDELGPIEIDGAFADPLKYAKRALDDARQPGAIGRAARARARKLINAAELKIGSGDDL